jgi:Ca2+-binding EF-hand superfamily protein
MLRIVRIVRVLRTGQDWAVITCLKAMIHGLAHSTHSFGAALVLLGGAMYIFALVFMTGTLQYIKTLQPADMEIQSIKDEVTLMSTYFGNISNTLWSLNLALAAGEDWNVMAESLMPAGVAYKVSFLAYILLILLGLMNILNGIFVSAAMQSSAMDKQLMIERMMRSRDVIAAEMVRLFVEADADGSGTISWEEFRTFMEDEKMQAYMLALEIDMSSAHKVFHLLDKDGSGELSIDDFVNGCIKLRGSAKMVDIATLEANTKKMLKQILHGIADLYKLHMMTSCNSDYDLEI